MEREVLICRSGIEHWHPRIPRSGSTSDPYLTWLKRSRYINKNSCSVRRNGPEVAPRYRLVTGNICFPWADQGCVAALYRHAHKIATVTMETMSNFLFLADENKMSGVLIPPWTLETCAQLTAATRPWSGCRWEPHRRLWRTVSILIS